MKVFRLFLLAVTVYLSGNFCQARPPNCHVNLESLTIQQHEAAFFALGLLWVEDELKARSRVEAVQTFLGECLKYDQDTMMLILRDCVYKFRSRTRNSWNFSLVDTDVELGAVLAPFCLRRRHHSIPSDILPKDFRALRGVFKQLESFFNCSDYICQKEDRVVRAREWLVAIAQLIFKTRINFYDLARLEVAAFSSLVKLFRIRPQSWVAGRIDGPEYSFVHWMSGVCGCGPELTEDDAFFLFCQMPFYFYRLALDNELYSSWYDSKEELEEQLFLMPKENYQEIVGWFFPDLSSARRCLNKVLKKPMSFDKVRCLRQAVQKIGVDLKPQRHPGLLNVALNLPCA